MIEKLLYQNEGERLDFKQTVNNLHKIAKTLSAFANTSGGKILIGVSDERTITGIDPEEEKYMVQKAADVYCHPPIAVKYKTYEVREENKSVLMVTIEQSNTKPHYATTKDGKQIAYIRYKDKCLPAGKNQVTLLEKSILKSIKDVRIGKNEKMLLDYLQKHDRITAKQFMGLVNISKRRAQRIIREMLLSGTIRVLEHEKEAYYTL